MSALLPGTAVWPIDDGRVHGVWLASFCLIASAWACVIWPLLTWSASVSAIAFWNAALISAWLFLISTAKLCMKSVHTADVPVEWAALVLEAACGAADLVTPKLTPAAEAVTTTAAPATATAPMAIPATRRWRDRMKVVMDTTTPERRLSFLMVL